MPPQTPVPDPSICQFCQGLVVLAVPEFALYQILQDGTVGSRLGTHQAQGERPMPTCTNPDCPGAGFAYEYDQTPENPTPTQIRIYPADSHTPAVQAGT